MIDTDLIESLEEPTRSDVKHALAQLVASGIVGLQMERELTRLASGSVNEDGGKLAERVLAYRRQNAALLAIKDLGESFLKEIDDAS